ncbi:MAG: hypothetical protein Q9217_004942 [Psora testacea]
MATADTATRPHDRHSRRRPFTTWVKRLANLKSSSSGSGINGTSKRNEQPPYAKSKKANTIKNNPYPTSGKPYMDAPVPASVNGRLSFHTPPSGRSMSYSSPTQSKTSIAVSSHSRNPPTISNKSAAPTLSTNTDTISSDAAHSKAGTTATLGGAVSSNGVGGGEGSTFSSPAPSVRSITTTLTTMQSTAPSTLLTAPNNQGQHAPLPVPQSNHPQQNSTNSHFSHQFPSSPPASAIPPYLNIHASGGHPTTYSMATANNLLTDNASVVTLASSSKRRRRNSLDTNASVRALAPSSLYGGSKESLPLSVLSANINDQASLTGPHPSRQVSVGLASTEKASVYSSSGIAPALPSERNSYYAAKQTNPGDGGSVRSGRIGHSRNDSITKSIGGLAAADSPLNSPREALVQGKSSRRNSGNSRWSEVKGDAEEDDQASLKKKHNE